MGYANQRQKQEYQRRWIARRRTIWFLDKCCVDCGSLEDLEIDHRDPMQKVSHRIWSWSKERRTTELEKCDVRCRECHRARHQGALVPSECPSQAAAA